MEILLVLVLSIAFCTSINMFGGNMNPRGYFYNRVNRPTYKTIWVLQRIPKKFIQNAHGRMKVKWSDPLQPRTVDIASSSTIYVTRTLSETTTFVTTSFVDSLTTQSVSSKPSQMEEVDYKIMKFNKISPSSVSRYVALPFKPPQHRIVDKRKKIFLKNTLKVASRVKSVDKAKKNDVHQSKIKSATTKNKTKHSMLSSILKNYSNSKYNELLPLEPSFNYCEEYADQDYHVHCKGCKKESDFLKMAKYFLFYTFNFAYFKFLSRYFMCPPSTFTTLSAVIVTSPTTLFYTSVSTSVNEIFIYSSTTVSSILSSTYLSILASYTTETTTLSTSTTTVMTDSMTSTASTTQTTTSSTTLTSTSLITNQLTTSLSFTNTIMSTTVSTMSPITMTITLQETATSVSTLSVAVVSATTLETTILTLSSTSQSISTSVIPITSTTTTVSSTTSTLTSSSTETSTKLTSTTSTSFSSTSITTTSTETRTSTSSTFTTTSTTITSTNSQTLTSTVSTTRILTQLIVIVIIEPATFTTIIGLVRSDDHIPELEFDDDGLDLQPLTNVNLINDLFHRSDNTLHTVSYQDIDPNYHSPNHIAVENIMASFEVDS